MTGYRHWNSVVVTLKNTELPLSHFRSMIHGALGCGRNFGKRLAVYTGKRDWF
jgi:hypothetical protein